jgi:hypothetical protein
MRWKGHGIGEKCMQILVVKPEEKRPLEHLGICGRIILKWSLKKGWEGMS